MGVVEILTRKRDGRELTHFEIQELTDEYLKGQVPDYQMAAFMMAVYFKGMSMPELAAFTEALVNSGEQLQWGSLAGSVVNKHSTGGLSDKTTLILAPLLAAAGLYMPKISGRAQGTAGGTVEQLESIPGFCASPEPETFMELVRQNGAAVTVHNEQLVPLDRSLLQLRQATATAQSIPLMAASIISKKIASGAKSIVLDVKVGSGSHLKTLHQAVDFANTLVALGQNFNRRTAALITDFSQPLGQAVGTVLEVQEAAETLRGGGPKDLVEVVLQLGGWLMAAAGKAGDPEEGSRRLEELRQSGAGWDRFKRIVQGQGGDPGIFDEKRLPEAKIKIPWTANREGYVHTLKLDGIGRAVALMDGGDGKDHEPFQPVGLLLEKKVGDHAAAGEPLGMMHLNDETNLEQIRSELRNAVLISKSQISAPVLIYRMVEG